MSRPHSLLIDLAAGRRIETEVDEEVVRSAEEHRMAGILKSAVDRGLSANATAIARLNKADALGWARNRMLLDAAKAIATRAKELDIDIFFIKGIANEARWYTRIGERPAWDIDLVLAPWHRNRLEELLRTLQPRHSLLNEPEALRSPRLQSIDFGFHDLPVDLHLDALKLEVASTPNPALIFAKAYDLTLDESDSIRVLGGEASLVLAALHLNKDRFRYLLSYVDLFRIATDPAVNLAGALQLAEALGLARSFTSTLATAAEDLGVPALGGLVADDRLWNLAWPASIRLLGSESEVRFRYRQFLLPLLEGGRWGEVLTSWWHRMLPPMYEVRRNFPSERGPYLLRLIRGRVRNRRDRYRQRRTHRLEQ
ncbi:MAG TPA: nucleotidyltransferase family protein [Acidimicrobiia bacterium]|nr:nucleotidyltransferase family protein [Acidimicrobiia bacterium]